LAEKSPNSAGCSRRADWSIGRISLFGELLSMALQALLALSRGAVADSFKILLKAEG